MAEETLTVTDAGGQEPEQTTTAPAEVEKPRAGSVADLPEWAQAIIKDLRKESAGYRTAKKATEKAAQLAEDERLAEQAEWQKLAEQRQARIAELEHGLEEAAQQAQERAIRASFMNHAAKLGATHPGDAYALGVLSSVNVDEEGNVSGVEEQVKVMVEAGRLSTQRAQAPSLDGGAGSGTPGQVPTPEVTDAQAQEFAARYGVDVRYVDRAMLASFLAQEQ